MKARRWAQEDDTPYAVHLTARPRKQRGPSDRGIKCTPSHRVDRDWQRCLCLAIAVNEISVLPSATLTGRARRRRSQRPKKISPPGPSQSVRPLFMPPHRPQHTSLASQASHTALHATRLDRSVCPLPLSSITLLTGIHCLLLYSVPCQEDLSYSIPLISLVT